MRKIILPQKILILFSSKLLEDPVFSIECSEGLLRWLMDEIEDIIKFQKKSLPEKSQKLDDPRTYFLKILPKPNDAPGNNLFKGVRRKFNTNLQNMLQAYHSFGFINIHEITTREKDERFFMSSQSGLLSDEGIIQFWESISQTIKAIDMKHKPKAITKGQSTQWDQHDSNKAQKRNREKDFHRKSYSSYDYRCSETNDWNSDRAYYSNSYYY